MFRRSGSTVAYYVDGKLPNPHDDAFGAKLADQRFRSIETAASEETSIGWVTSGDPTGDTFELEDMDIDAGIWLRIRFDKKALPTVWLKIHRAVAERSAGRPLSARERKELKEDLSEKLLPRTLPTVQFVDVLYLPKQQRILLFGTSKRIREEFEKLFFKTFAVSVVAATPYTLAQHSGLGREALAYLDQVSPVPWPREGGVADRQMLADEDDGLEGDHEEEFDAEPSEPAPGATVTDARASETAATPEEASRPDEDADLEAIEIDLPEPTEHDA